MTLYTYSPDVPLTFQPLDAPRPITRPEAERIADDEYAIRESRDGGWMRLSMGADGGMHYRGHDITRDAAAAWRDRKREHLAARIMRGECTHTLTFDHGSDRFYLA